MIFCQDQGQSWTTAACEGRLGSQVTLVSTGGVCFVRSCQVIMPNKVGTYMDTAVGNICACYCEGYPRRHQERVGDLLHTRGKHFFLLACERAFVELLKDDSPQRTTRIFAAHHLLTVVARETRRAITFVPIGRIIYATSVIVVEQTQTQTADVFGS